MTTKQLREALKSTSTSTLLPQLPESHVADWTGPIVLPADPAVVKAERDLRKAADMLAESHSLNWVSATDQQRLAARLALSTARSLKDLVA